MHFMRPTIFDLSKEAQEHDKDTATRLIGKKLFQGLQEEDKCYLLHKVVDFYLRNDLASEELHRKYSHIKKVREAFTTLKMSISKCDVQEMKKVDHKLEELEREVRKLGKNREAKVVGELYMLFQDIGKYCSKPRTGKKD
ncbi:interleukin-22 [Callorhinchus milii]|uniref:interleukin-22 n=1 Tax=Callorhinchus milii TaxID=7868 RepID=UPI001C3F5C87|nr:interleukin-22 [Callorhinchus milii]